MHPIIDEWDTELRSADPLCFPGYAERLAAIGGESVRTGRCEHYVVLEGDFDVFGGSMGVVHGEKVVRAIDRAIDLRLPVVAVTRSGGARMQEGMISLIQMGRTAAAMGRHHEAGLLSLGVYLSPTTGGVLVSYGSLCDLAAAETGATLGFAGPRVAKTMTGESVGGRSHTAETAYDAGLIDAIGDESALRSWVEVALGLKDSSLEVRALPVRNVSGDANNADSPGHTEDDNDAWAQVCAARRTDRPSGIDVATELCTSWSELHSTDPVVRGGLATIGGQRVVVVALDRHVGTGRPTPAGYRLACRAFELASRLGLPIVTFIDTPGAEPGSEAELDGLARAIARTFLVLGAVAVPTVAVCVGEGGSGGGLAFGVTDRLLVQRHAIFSVIGPEGAAMILHRDASKAADVARDLALTSADLLRMGIVDGIVGETSQDVQAAVVDALRGAKVGDRLVRMDAASAPWVRVEH